MANKSNLRVYGTLESFERRCLCPPLGRGDSECLPRCSPPLSRRIAIEDSWTYKGTTRKSLSTKLRRGKRVAEGSVLPFAIIDQFALTVARRREKYAGNRTSVSLCERDLFDLSSRRSLRALPCFYAVPVTRIVEHRSLLPILPARSQKKKKKGGAANLRSGRITSGCSVKYSHGYTTSSPLFAFARARSRRNEITSASRESLRGAARRLSRKCILSIPRHGARPFSCE